MSLVTACFGANLRSATAHVPLMLAYGLAMTGRPTTLIRAAEEFAGMDRYGVDLPRSLQVVEYRADVPALAGIGIDAHLTAAMAAGEHVMLDMPLASLCDPDLRERVTLPVLPVGPTALDECVAARVMRDAEAQDCPMRSRDGDAPPLWLLGCGRSGLGSAALFEAAMRRVCDAWGVSGDVRTLPLTLPGLTRSEADALARGRPGATLLRRVLPNLAALEVAAANPFAPAIDSQAFWRAIAADRQGSAGVGARSLRRRLHDLADALADLEDGGHAPGELGGTQEPYDPAADPDLRARIMSAIARSRPVGLVLAT